MLFKDGRCALRGTVFLLVQKDGEERALPFGVPFFLFFPHERKEEAPGGRNPCGG